MSRIKQSYYWPKLPSTVKQYIRTCRDCQRRKTPPGRPAGLLQPVQIPETPFQQIGMDFLGPFPTSHAGNKWILVATDYLTRYAETKALQRCTALDVAHFFIENIVLRIQRRGTAFNADLVRAVMNLTGTSHRKSTAYHPQTNGLTERLNKTLADMLSMYVDEQHKSWDQVLPYVTFAYNTARQETTRMTPFALVYGREATTMLDAMLPHDGGGDDTTAQEFAQRAEEARQLARHRIRQQQLHDATTYNARHRHAAFQPGDNVWVWSPIRRRGLCEKLMKRYFGPYRVLQQLSDVTYAVTPVDSVSTMRRRCRPEVVHIVRMKPFFART